ncbi:hypothetical protein [Cupriavidus sp. CuC1]|uniref:hypothetical protein n=1 Tax=Cupriavidus sp. CuC1 TaxID=3373131 RepID=UPI0037D735FA
MAEAVAGLSQFVEAQEVAASLWAELQSDFATFDSIEKATGHESYSLHTILELLRIAQIGVAAKIQAEYDEKKKDAVAQRVAHMANAKHKKNRSAKEVVRAAWKSGEYRTKDACAAAEAPKHNVAVSTARGWIQGDF